MGGLLGKADAKANVDVHPGAVQGRATIERGAVQGTATIDRGAVQGRATIDSGAVLGTATMEHGAIRIMGMANVTRISTILQNF